jgi:predicted AlkP superfamily phosphohydrolase/phosphomutase
MNSMDYLESVRNFLLTDSRINGHQILREYEDVEKSYIRARLTLTDESVLEISEYIEQDTKNEITIIAYSYHWSDHDGKLLRRWDNTKHFPKLKDFPNHIHDGETNEVTPGAPINIFAILDEIAKIIGE